MEPTYTREFHGGLATGAASSASVVVPLVAELLGEVRSVADYGCGTGEWLAEWQRLRAEVAGTDGGYVDREQLVIEDFTPADLTAGDPFAGHPFDLVMSVEVAEHLPAEQADRFVDMLASHGDAVLFSAAVPHQGGTFHINEQWPDYWITRFTERGFRPFDLLRAVIWTDERVEPWYRQNLLIFARGDVAQRLEALPVPPMPLRVVHPVAWEALATAEPKLTLRQAVKGLRPGLAEAVRHRLRRR